MGSNELTVETKAGRTHVASDSQFQIADNERQSWISLAMVWTGSMICVSSLMVGGVLVSGLSLTQAILAGFIGYGVIVAFMACQGMQASDTGLPTVRMAAGALGERGSKILTSLCLGIACLGWFAFQTDITGSAFSNIMYGMFGWQIPVSISSFIWGIIMLVTAIYGFNALKYLNYIAVPALVAVCIYGVWAAIDTYGLGALNQYSPPEPISMLTGISLAVGSFAVGGVIAGDYARYAKSRSDVLKAATIGVIPSGLAMISMGAIMSLVAGSYDISEVLATLGVPALGLVALILATWTTNAVNAYSGGLAITDLFNLSENKRGMATALAGLAGTLIATVGVIDHFVSFLGLLTAAIPPVAGVMIADYWITKKGDPKKFAINEQFNWTGIIAFIAGAIAAIVIKVGIPPITGILTTIIVYCLLNKLATK